VLTVDRDAIGHVFDVATGRALSAFRPAYRAGVTCLAWSPDDSVVAQCDTKSFVGLDSPAALDTWDPRTGRLVHSAPSPRFIEDVAFSPDSSLYVFTTTPPAPKGARVSAVALSQAQGLDGTFVYGSRSGRLVKAFPEPASVASFSPSTVAGLTLAYATIGDELGHVYNFTSGVELLLTGHSSVIESIGFNRAGTEVITAGKDNTARVYDARSGTFLEQLAGDVEPIRAASFGLGDTAIATSSDDGSVRVWTSPDTQPAVALPGDRRVPATVGFSSDSRRIVEAEIAGHGRILDARDLHQLAAFAAPPGEWFDGAAESRDGRMVAALTGLIGTGGALVGPTAAATYDAGTGRPLATMTPPAPGAPPITGALDYAGDRLVTVGSNGAADEWDPRTGRHLESLPGTGIAEAVAYSRDGSLLAIAHLPALPAKVTLTTQFGDVTIDLWDARTGRRRRRITGDLLEPQTVGTREFAPLSLAFGPDGRTIALSGADTAVELYSTRTGLQKGNLPLN
jgi:WD40 repeat protein